MATPTTIASVPAAVRTPIALSIQRSLEPFSLPVPALDFANAQVVGINTASTTSSVFDSSNDRVVEMSCNADCLYTVGTAPITAGTGSGNQFMAAGSLRYVYVGAGNIVAVTQSSTTGSLYIVASLIAAYVG